MKVAIASDHGGIELKKFILERLSELEIDFENFGTDSGDSVDYPDYARKVIEALSGKDFNRGILICGTGIGMSIAANRVEGIRATLCHDGYTARMSRRHNNSNLLVLGGRVTGRDVAGDILDIWLNTEFEGGRHSRRLNKIEDIEKG